MKRIVYSLAIMVVSILMLPQILADENISFSLISNVTLYHNNYSCSLGKCGEITDRIITPSNPEGIPVGYLFEGESAEFDVEFYLSPRIEDLSDMYVTIGTFKGVGNDNVADINPAEYTEYIDPPYYVVRSCKSLWHNHTTAHYHCRFITTNREYEYGIYFIGVDARSYPTDINPYGELAMNDFGNYFFNTYWFLNPILGVGLDNPISFSEAEVGKRVYSEPITITNKAELGSEMLLHMSIFGKEFYDNFARELNCSANIAPNISYFASNGVYNTKQDLRADADGFVLLPYNNEVIFGNNSQANILNQYSDNITLTFRLDIPQECSSGELKESNITITGTEPSSGQSASVNVPVKLIAYIPTCSTNLDCKDNNTLTEDTCINPAKINSTCQHLSIKCFLNSDCGTDGLIGNSFCMNNSKTGNYLSFSCTNPGTSASYCTNKTEQKLVESCKFGCTNGTCIKDSDNDGVPDNTDKCPGTRLPEKFIRLFNHYGDTDGDKIFETITKSKLSNSNYSLNDTKGCSCHQILDIKPGRNIGEEMFGCTEGTIKEFIKKSNIRSK